MCIRDRESIKSESRGDWTAESITEILTKAKLDGYTAQVFSTWYPEDLDQVIQSVSTMDTHIQLVDLFWLKYPYLYVLIRIKKGASAEMFLKQFESLQEDPEQWMRYTHLYLLPYFDMLRQQNKLKHVTKKVKVDKY